MNTPGPFGDIEMGGMFTLVKVREGITSYDDPGWFKNPSGTVASLVPESEVPKDQPSSNANEPATPKTPEKPNHSGH